MTPTDEPKLDAISEMRGGLREIEALQDFMLKAKRSNKEIAGHLRRRLDALDERVRVVRETPDVKPDEPKKPEGRACPCLCHSPGFTGPDGAHCPSCGSLHVYQPLVAETPGRLRYIAEECFRETHHECDHQKCKCICHQAVDSSQEPEPTSLEQCYRCGCTPCDCGDESSLEGELEEFIDYWGALDSAQEDIDRKLMRDALGKLLTQSHTTGYDKGYKEGERSAYGSASTWVTNFPKADKLWHEMLLEELTQGEEVE